MSNLDPAQPRNDWTRAQIAALFDLGMKPAGSGIASERERVTN
jgi:hypothetical protein